MPPPKPRVSYQQLTWAQIRQAARKDWDLPVDASKSLRARREDFTRESELEKLRKATKLQISESWSRLLRPDTPIPRSAPPAVGRPPPAGQNSWLDTIAALLCLNILVLAWMVLLLPNKDDAESKERERNKEAMEPARLDMSDGRRLPSRPALIEATEIGGDSERRE